MGRAKEIRIKPISAQDANAFVKRVHYSGKKVNGSKIHFGVFLNGHLLGVLQFGCPMDKRKASKFVHGSKWNEFLELNRMAFHDELPRNSESRAIAYCLRFLKKKYPYLRWILSYSDATQCGDGTIYRASGFYLTAIKINKQILRLPDGSVIARKTLDDWNHVKKRGSYRKDPSLKPLPGFQLRYIFLFDKDDEKKLTVPILPYSKIEDVGATMYKGKRALSKDSVAVADQAAEGGAIPTSALHSTGD